MCAADRLEIPDVHDDIARELSFYEMALTAVKEGRSQLKDMVRRPPPRHTPLEP